jgi:glycosyltransferase involved in cell wall biosynthesis
MGHIQPKRTSWLRQLIFEAVIIFTNRVRINNTTEQSFLMGRGVNKNKLYVVPIAVDSSQFYNCNPGHLKRKDIFYYGNTTTQKGIPTILEALVEVRKKLPETRLHIIGSRGNYNPEQDILRLGLTDIVIQHGAFLHGEKLNSILNQYSVFVLSTKAEGQCLAVYESALSGAALCIPNIMSFTDIFEHKALFHEFGDKDTLAENIITYLSNPDIATKHNQLAVDMILSEYNEEVVKQAFVKLLTF